MRIWFQSCLHLLCWFFIFHDHLGSFRFWGWVCWGKGAFFTNPDWPGSHCSPCWLTSGSQSLEYWDYRSELPCWAPSGSSGQSDCVPFLLFEGNWWWRRRRRRRWGCIQSMWTLPIPTSLQSAGETSLYGECQSFVSLGVGDSGMVYIVRYSPVVS